MWSNRYCKDCIRPVNWKMLFCDTVSSAIRIHQYCICRFCNRHQLLDTSLIQLPFGGGPKAATEFRSFNSTISSEETQLVQHFTQGYQSWTLHRIVRSWNCNHLQRSFIQGKAHKDWAWAVRCWRTFGQTRALKDRLWMKYCYIFVIIQYHEISSYRLSTIIRVNNGYAQDGLDPFLALYISNAIYKLTNSQEWRLKEHRKLASV